MVGCFQKCTVRVVSLEGNVIKPLFLKITSRRKTSTPGKFSQSLFTIRKFHFKCFKTFYLYDFKYGLIHNLLCSTCVKV